MKIKNKSWNDLLSGEYNKPYFKSLTKFIDKSYSEKTCFPPKDLIFNAFEHCPLESLKVVILGQDPYHNTGQANGYAFAVPNECKTPPSLKNIIKELCTDIGIEYFSSDCINLWPSQGVLLLNTILTVEAHKPGSHKNCGWKQFTSTVIKQISAQKEGVVFMLWGTHAHQKLALIDSKKHLILKSAHPSPLSANRGLWFGHKHFSKANEYRSKYFNDSVDWMLNK